MSCQYSLLGRLGDYVQLDSFLVYTHSSLAIAGMTCRGEERTDSLLDEHAHNLSPLITLQLNDLTHLLILYQTTIAREFLYPPSSISKTREKEERGGAHS